MEKRFTAKCLDCKQRFEDKIGGLETDVIYRCQKCGDRKIVPLTVEKTIIPENCEKCGGVLGADLPICPRCYSANVKILRYIKSTTKK